MDTYQKKEKYFNNALAILSTSSADDIHIDRYSMIAIALCC
jgi:hypothetical protein